MQASLAVVVQTGEGAVAYNNFWFLVAGEKVDRQRIKRVCSWFLSRRIRGMRTLHTNMVVAKVFAIVLFISVTCVDAVGSSHATFTYPWKCCPDAARQLLDGFSPASTPQRARAQLGNNIVNATFVSFMPATRVGTSTGEPPPLRGRRTSAVKVTAAASAGSAAHSNATGVSSTLARQRLPINCIGPLRANRGIIPASYRGARRICDESFRKEKAVAARVHARQRRVQ